MSQTTMIFGFILGVLAVRTIGTDRTADDGRLSGDTEPLAYVLNMVPRYDKDGDRYTVDGQVEILIKANRFTPNITMHAKDLYVTSVTVTEVVTETELPVDSYDVDRDNELLYVYVGKYLLVGRQYNVRITFRGLLRTDMTGFYRSTYTVNNNTMWMAVSQFKPIYARRSFPCYDEPGYKTPFNISLGRLKHQMTLSNARFSFTQRLQYFGLWMDHYEPTKPISTYMVAILVGNLKKSVMLNSEMEVSVYTYDDHLTQTGYALDETSILYEAMENYTGVNGEVEKMDLLALPDFDPDGGENWGLNSYREMYVLFDDDSKTKFKEQSSMLIEQQQSHQWFGNLVTYSWWSHLWISEGFSRYFQYFVMDSIKWDWRLEHMFVVEQHQTAMTYDQTPRHPLTGSINGNSDIQRLFNPITYNKAAAILRMIKYTVTEDRFRVPLQLFLNKYKYNVVSSVDLWSVFENYYFDMGFALKENVPFINFVTSWTDLLGYPVINVTYEITQDQFIITQTRFSVWPLTEAEPGQWFIGLTYTDNLQKNFTDLVPMKWMHPESQWTFIRVQQQINWYIFNIQSTGFYRVNYDKDNWNRLIKQLNDSYIEIHVLNRAQLIDDSFNLARAGILDYSTALDLSTYLVKEDDSIPWLTAIECLTYVVERMRRSTEGYVYIKSYVRNLAETIYNKTEVMVLKHKAINHTILTSWNTFSVWACYLDSQYCMRNAMGYFEKWSKGEKISPDIKDAALCTGIKFNGDESTWKGVLEVYMTTRSASEKNSAQSGLTCSQNSTILYKYLDLLSNSTSSVVRLQDYKDISKAMSLTPQGIEALTNFLMINMEQILRYIPTGDSIVMYIYSVLASKVAIDSEIIKLNNIKNAYGLPSKIKESFDKSYEYVEQNLRWYNTYHSSINKWLGAPMEPNKPVTIESKTTESITTEIVTVEPATTGHATTEPATTEPATTEPATTEPATTKPITTEFVTFEPVTLSRSTKPTTVTPEYSTFDLLDEPIRIISRCPDTCGAQSSQGSGFTLVILFIALIVSSKIIMH